MTAVRRHIALLLGGSALLVGFLAPGSEVLAADDPVDFTSKR